VSHLFVKTLPGSWRGPKHVEVTNNIDDILRILCTKLVSFTRLYADARPTERKMHNFILLIWSMSFS